MPNSSTIRRQVAGTQQLTLAPLTGSVISTTATAFQLNNNALTLTGGGVIPLSAGVTGLYAGTGQVLHISAAGKFTGAADDDLTLTLYEVPASLLPIANTLAGAQTFTNWNSLGASSSIAIDGVSGGFTFDARVQLSSTGQLDGQYTVQIDGAAPTAWSHTTTVTGLVGEQDLNFVLVATLGVGGAATILTLDEFRLDWE
jgi:hypothetical protein